ncbi:hypothetical protein ACFQJ8_23260 [Halocatena marina]
MSEQFPSWRALLAATGSAGAALIAGCLGGATPVPPAAQQRARRPLKRT